MSADLPRRAAIVLRQHAQAATPGPWEALAQTSDGQNFVSDAPGSDAKHVTIEVVSHDGWYVVNLIRQRADAELIALLRRCPDLLADLFEAAAARPDGIDNDVWAEFEALARAVLREEES